MGFLDSKDFRVFQFVNIVVAQERRREEGLADCQPLVRLWKVNMSNFTTCFV